MKEIKCTILYCVCENFCDSILLRFRFCNTAWNSFKPTVLNLWGPGSYLRILAEVDNAAEEVEETLEALEWLEQVDEGVRRQLLVVLGGNLNAHLKVGRYYTRQWSQIVFRKFCDIFTSFFNIKSHEDVKKPLKSRVFFIFFACW